MRKSLLKNQFDANKIIEYPSFYTYNERKRSPLIITVEHAGNIWPESEKLGAMPDAWQDQHYSYDPGAKLFALKLATNLGCPVVFGKYSRVVVDLNRIVGAEDIVRHSNDGVNFPMNYALDGEKKYTPVDTLDRRVNEFYLPYHRKVREILQRSEDIKHLCIHSYAAEKSTTDATTGDWHVGIQYPIKNQMVESALEYFSRLSGKKIGDNQPYNLRNGLPGAISLHAASFGIDTVELEFRDDQLVQADLAKFWLETTTSWMQEYLQKKRDPSNSYEISLSPK